MAHGAGEVSPAAQRAEARCRFTGEEAGVHGACTSGPVLAKRSHAAAETRAVRGLVAQPARIPSSSFTASRTEGSVPPWTSTASGTTHFPPE